MKAGPSIALLSLVATVLVAIYIHERAHRFDLVTAAAASGGSQDTTGDTVINAYLIDHQTGRVWVYGGGSEGEDLARIAKGHANPMFFQMIPLGRLSCSDLGETETRDGCKSEARNQGVAP